MLKKFIPPVKLLIPALFADLNDIPKIRELITGKYGPLDRETEPQPWTFTDYYAGEMGPTLYRVFFFPEELIDRLQLPAIKNQTIQWEGEFSLAGRRRVNLDPGYMSEGPLILASTKNFFHRIYLEQDIFAEVTLYYKQNEYHTLPWTYPDYAAEECKQMLKEVRMKYRKQLELLKSPS